MSPLFIPGEEEGAEDIPRFPILPDDAWPIIVPGNEVDNLALLQSNLGHPIPLAYGRHLVRGNIIFQHKQSETNTRIFIALGDGEWDGIEVLFINGKVTPLSSLSHFHPGIDGETGTETTPNNGNQKICSLWPATFTDKFTFSNTAYLGLSLGVDVEAVGPGFDILGIYRTRKVRIFDSAGAITSFVYSTNPAWICLDIIIEHEIRRRALVGSALTAAQKERIDFQSFIDWAADCDVDIGGGKKRFEANIAITRQTDLKRAVELLLITGRAYIITTNGKLTAAMDKSRSSVATITRDEILEGGLSFGRKSTRNLANRVKIQYRNLVSGDGVGTFSTVGTTLTGSSTKFLEMYKPGEPIQARSGAQDGEVQVVDTITSDTAGTLKAAFSSDQTTQSHGNPALDFQISIRESFDETNISETGKEIPIDLDLGNVDAGQAERTANYLLARTQLLRQAAFIVPPGQVAAGDGPIEWTPGEVITGPKDVEADTTETELWEILEAEDLPNGERQVGVQIFDATIFSDAESDQQAQTQTVENDGTDPVTDGTVGLTKLPAIPGEIIFYDGWDTADILRWTVSQNDGNPGITHPAGFEVGQSLREEDDGAGTGLAIYKEFPAQNKWVGERFLFRMAEGATGGQLSATGFRNVSADNAIFLINADDGTDEGGTFQSQSSPNVTVVDNFKRGVWHEIIQLVDAEDQKVFYIIDGRVYDNGGAGYDYDTAATSLNRFWIQDNIASVGVDYKIDDLYLFLLAEDKATNFITETGILQFQRSTHASYRPLTNMLTATPTVVSIAAFTLRIGGVDKTVSLGSLTSLTADTLYYIYFDRDDIDTATPWSVTFASTTTKETALGADGRFFIGSIRTPKTGAADTVGNNDGGTAAQWGGGIKHAPTATQTSGTGNDTNLANMIDGDWATFGEKQRVGLDTENTTGNIGAITFRPGGNQFAFRTTLRIRLKYQIIAVVTIGIPTVTAAISLGSFSASVSRSTVGTTDSGVVTVTQTIGNTADIEALVAGGQIDYVGNAAGDRGTATVRIYEAEIIEEG
jgi:hypothetical protein